MDETTDIERISKKTRRHLTVSRELDEAAPEVLPKYRNFSEWAEEVLWRALVEEYGREQVVEAIQEAQEQFDDDDLVGDEYRDELGLPA